MVVYAAQVNSGPATIHYESLLECGPVGPVLTTHKLGQILPRLDGDIIEWKSPGLGVFGHWRRREKEIHETIFRTENGSIEWRCVLPAGAASIKTPNSTLDGLGYVEHLQMTIPPWRIPIRTLRWGRFVGDRTALVWIDWKGNYNTSVAYINGVPVRVLHVDDTLLSLDGGIRLELDRGLVLRRGDLGSTVLKAVPSIGKIAPARMFALDECKWRSRARLLTPDATHAGGWAIHEVVRWP